MKRAAVIGAVLAYASLLGPTNAFAVNVVPDLGDAANFAFLAMEQDNDAPQASLSSDSTVTGDIGVGPAVNSADDPDLDLGSGTSIVGTVYISPGIDPDGTPGNSDDFIDGSFTSIVHNADLSDPIADALAASAAIELLTSTQVLPAITDGQTINGGSPDNINVIFVPSISLTGGDSNLVLNAPADEYFIIKLTGASDPVLNISGDTDIVLIGGIDGSHVLYYIPMTTPDGDTEFVVDITGAASMDGTILAPYGDIKFHGDLTNGALIGNDINLGSSGDLTHVPFNPPPPPPPPQGEIPEPASGLLLGLGLLAARRATRRSSR